MKINPATWSIRAKFISILMLVFLIPFSVISVLKEVEKTLVDSLKNNLSLASELASRQLSTNNQWFNESLLPRSEKFIAKELFVFPLKEKVLMDGFFDEWHLLETYRQQFKSNDKASEDSINLLLSESQSALYLSLSVFDEKIIYPDTLNEFVADHVVINFQDEVGQYYKIIISPRAPGKIPVKREFNGDVRIDWRFNAVWSEVAGGFNLELKFPNGVRPKQLNLIHQDIDKAGARSHASFSATNRYELSPVVWPSQSIANFVDEIELLPGRRLWVLDASGRALARKDSLQQIDYSASDSPLINWLLGTVPSSIKDKRANQLRLNSKVIFDAMKGSSASSIESSGQDKYSIALAASPIKSGEKVIGVVFIEENVAKVQLLQQKTLAQMIYITGGILIVILSILVWYISKLTSRVTNLKKQINQVVDEQGRMQSNLRLEYVEGDEIDELNNAFLKMGNRLYEYNDYLEKLASRLSHELRTPIAIVRSSLDNLLLNSREDQAEVLQRAIDGVERLGEIISRMRRATGIKQAMQTAELEEIDLVMMIRMLVEGFQHSFPNYAFRFETNQDNLLYKISGDLVAEMLDKLVSNAMDFSVQGSEILVSLQRSQSGLVLFVENKGPTIPKKNLKRIFQSLVSIREDKNKEGTNLGLGLYVVKLIAEFHGASAKAENLDDNSGVRIKIEWDRK